MTIVTVVRDGALHGLTASSFAAVSLEPPLVLVCLDKRSRTRAMLLEVNVFGVNVLNEEQRDVAIAFAEDGPKDFERLPHHVDDTGAVFLDEAIASFGCTTVEVVEGGDHDIFIGEVETTATREGRPLLYYDRDYRGLS